MNMPGFGKWASNGSIAYLYHLIVPRENLACRLRRTGQKRKTQIPNLGTRHLIQEELDADLYTQFPGNLRIVMAR